MTKLFLMLAALVIPSIASAQVDIGEMIKPEKGQPIDIKSDSMVIKNNENMAIFTDNVRVQQGKMNMRSDKLLLYTQHNEKTGKTSFKRIEATGNVDFKTQDKSVLADKAEYDVPSGLLVLTGNVRLKDADASLQGKIFRYNVNTGSSEIRNTGEGTGIAPYNPKAAAAAGTKPESVAAPSSGGRVRAVFTPGEDVKEFEMPLDTIQNIRGKNPDQTVPQDN